MSLSFPLCTDGHSYRETAKAISAEIRDRERTPTEAAADVIEQARQTIGEIGGDLSVVDREVLRCWISKGAR